MCVQCALRVLCVTSNHDDHNSRERRWQKRVGELQQKKCILHKLLENDREMDELGIPEKKMSKWTSLDTKFDVDINPHLPLFCFPSLHLFLLFLFLLFLSFVCSRPLCYLLSCLWFPESETDVQSLHSTPPCSNDTSNKQLTMSGVFVLGGRILD